MMKTTQTKRFATIAATAVLLVFAAVACNRGDDKTAETPETTTTIESPESTVANTEQPSETATETDSSTNADAEPIAEGSLVGQAAPAFTLKTLNGQSFNPSQTDGKVIVMDFWATWCGPCRMAIPVLQAMHDQYGAQGLRVVGISNENPAKVTDFVKKQNMTYSIVGDEAATDAAFIPYEASAIPTLVVIDKKGVVRFYENGFDSNPAHGTKAKLEKLLPQLLAEQA